MKTFRILIALSATTLGALAQEQPAQDQESGSRVQYNLILPDEKTAELVKDEEMNPFESSAGVVDDKGNTEENKVRDILQRLPVTGGVVGDNGMRIMLGGMRLE